MRARESMLSKAALLAAYGLEGLEDGVLHERRYLPGSYLLRAGFPLGGLLFVQSGSAKVSYNTENGRTLLFCFSGPGEVLGDVELLMQADAATSSVQAVTETVCLALPTAAARRELQSNIVFSNRLGTAVAQKLNNSTHSRVEAFLLPLDERLRRYIGMTAQNGRFDEKRTALAEQLGVSYRHLLRTLERLCAEGFLERDSRGYRVR